MGLFDEIQRQIREAIEEAQNAGRPQRPRPQRPRPRPRPAQPPPEEPAPAPEPAVRPEEDAARRRVLERRSRERDQATARQRRRTADERLSDAYLIRHALEDPAELRRAIVLKEILGPPRARGRR